MNISTFQYFKYFCIMRKVIFFSIFGSWVHMTQRLILIKEGDRSFNLLGSLSYLVFLVYEISIFIALIHPIQWTIANPVGADRPAKRQKKTSCVSTSRPVPVLCTPQMAPHISFLSRQPDVIASFSFGACTVQTCFLHLQTF